MGYPIGTKCVIVRAVWPSSYLLGLTPLITGESFIWIPGMTGLHGNLIKGPKEHHNLALQPIDLPIPKFKNKRSWYYPVDWMRPIDKDIDEIDEWIIHEYTRKQSTPIRVASPSRTNEKMD